MPAKPLLAADLFCGAGGTSIGNAVVVEQAQALCAAMLEDAR